MSDTMSGDYVNAITAERAVYQRGYLRGGHGTHQQESLMDAHARKCARIIAQAYRMGDYTDMWRALSTSARYDMCSPLTHHQRHHQPPYQPDRMGRAAY